MIKRLISFFIGCSIFLISIATLASYPPVPTPFRYVSDYTQTLSTQEWQTLENALVEYSQRTSSQIAVAMVPTTNGEEIAHYTHTLFNRWSIGQKGLNNGVLLLIAKNDRKLFIATGRGLEGALPDAIASSIIRNDITPYFKQNLYAQGIAKGLSSIIAATQGEYAPLQDTIEDDEGFSGSDIFIAFTIIIFLLFNVLARKGGGVYISPNQAERIIRTTESFRRSGGFDRGFGGGGNRGGYGGGRSGGFGGGNTGGGGAGGSW